MRLPAAFLCHIDTRLTTSRAFSSMDTRPPPFFRCVFIHVHSWPKSFAVDSQPAPLFPAFATNSALNHRCCLFHVRQLNRNLETMRTEKQIEASRLNGANVTNDAPVRPYPHDFPTQRSTSGQGPVTAAGNRSPPLIRPSPLDRVRRKAKPVRRATPRSVSYSPTPWPSPRNVPKNPRAPPQLSPVLAASRLP
jgi:hypothetical protein